MANKNINATNVATLPALNAEQILKEAMALRGDQKSFTAELSMESVIILLKEALANVSKDLIVGTSNNGKNYAFLNTSFTFNKKRVIIALFADENVSTELCKAKAVAELAGTRLMVPATIKNNIIAESLTKIIAEALIEPTDSIEMTNGKTIYRNAKIYVLYDSEFGQFRLVKKYQYEKANKVNQVVLPVQINKEEK